MITNNKIINILENNTKKRSKMGTVELGDDVIDFVLGATTFTLSHRPCRFDVLLDYRSLHSENSISALFHVFSNDIKY